MGMGMLRRGVDEIDELDAERGSKRHKDLEVPEL